LLAEVLAAAWWVAASVGRLRAVQQRASRLWDHCCPMPYSMTSDSARAWVAWS